MRTFVLSVAFESNVREERKCVFYERAEKANLVALCLARGDDVERRSFFFFLLT